MSLTPANGDRILVLAPDADAIVAIFQRRGFSAKACDRAAELAVDISNGAGCAILDATLCTRSALEPLYAVLAAQPAWSDFPLIVLGDDADLTDLANVVLIPSHNERVLVTAAQAALRARTRQYDTMRAAMLRDQFLSMLGHELRNPIGVVLMTTQTMEMKTGENGAFSRERILIARQARHVSRLVDDLLDVSRVGSGKIVLHRTRLDLNDAAEHALRVMRVNIDAPALSFSLQRAPGPVWVWADPLRIEQILLALLNNAVKYSPDGGKVEIIIDSTDQGAELRVRDHGIGIPRDMLGHVFDLFAQLDHTLDRSRGGLGIGLTLVKALVDLHGGSVRALSDGPGCGAELVVQLPLSTGAERVDVHAAPAPRKKQAKHRVLVIEDNPDLRNALGEALELLGYNVEMAADGTTGLASAKNEPPAAAFIDIGLPGLDGYGVARGIRAALGKRVYLVALSGYSGREDRERALEAGFDHHITKPASLMTLRTTLAQLDKTS